MKLPLITRKANLANPTESSIFHVLAFEGESAIGVNESTLTIEKVPFNTLSVLNEEEYKKRKEELKKAF